MTPIEIAMRYGLNLRIVYMTATVRTIQNTMNAGFAGKSGSAS